MKTKIILALFAILLIILTAGCVQTAQPVEEASGNRDQVTGEETQTSNPEPQTIETEPEPECENSADCDDGEECTSNACTNGKCVNTVETGCLQKTSSDPYISEVNFDDDDEWIVIKADNYRVDDWTIENQEGVVFYTFKDYTTLNNYLKIHTGRGFATNVNWYLYQDEFWNEGDTVILRNAGGGVVSEMQG